MSDFINLTDLAPTFLEAAGVAVPAAVTGESLVEILAAPENGRVDRHRNKVFIGRERHTPAQEAPLAGGYPMRAIRTDHFLYIRNFEPDRWPAGTPDHTRTFMDDGWLGDSDNGPTKSYLWAHRKDSEVKPFYDLSFAKRPAEELYDLRTDPAQIHNVANDADYAEEKARLHEELLAELRRTDDPRVFGGGEAFDSFPYTGSIPRWLGQEEIESYRQTSEEEPPETPSDQGPTPTL